MPSGIYIRTEEHRQRISESLKGKMPKFIPDNTGRKRPDMTGTNHWLWKGNQVGYDALHDWVNRHLGKADHCENNSTHFSSRYHWANVSGEYKRELSDWRQVCPSCNRRDGIHINQRFFERGDSYGSL